jgi:hypothetical protein
LENEIQHAIVYMMPEVIELSYDAMPDTSQLLVAGAGKEDMPILPCHKVS